MFKLIRFILFLLTLAVLPFIALIRVAVYAHTEYHYSAYTSLGIGVISVAVLVFMYFTIIHRWITGRIGDYAGIKRRSFIAILIVSLYSFHALFFLSSDHTKSNQVAKEFTQIHPILRLSTSTLAYIDKGLIMTDAERVPEDYRKMGLPTNKASLHYRQADGYVYAIDIRVNHRSEIKSALATLYFRMMGLRTLRHGGTGDHLHISLFNHDRPYAK